MLALVAAIALKHHVTVVTVRNQRTVDDGNLTQFPFSVNLQGAFLDVTAFEREIETGAAKIAVESFQTASSDESTDTVAATVTVEAYMVDSQTTTSSGKKPASTAVKNGKDLTSTPTAPAAKAGSHTTTQPASPSAAKGEADGQKTGSKTRL